MKDKTIKRGLERVVEVRSEAGKLLFIKTKRGYELKCPRSKKLCLISYEKMLYDCIRCLDKDLSSVLVQAFQKEAGSADQSAK